MLTVYEKGNIEKKIVSEPVIDFDGWFDNHTGEIVIDKTVERIMAEIDKAEFIGNNQIRNRFGDVTDIKNLSTGTKAVICVYSYPKKVFDLSQCGNNAVTCAFTLPRGRTLIYLDERCGRRISIQRRRLQPCEGHNMGRNPYL